MIATSASTDVLRHGWLDAAATLAPDIPEIADLLSARLNDAIASGHLSEGDLMSTIAEVESTASRAGSSSGGVLARRLRRTVYEYLLALDANTAVEAQNAAIYEAQQAAAELTRAAEAAHAAEQAAAQQAAAELAAAELAAAELAAAPAGVEHADDAEQRATGFSADDPLSEAATPTNHRAAREVVSPSTPVRPPGAADDYVDAAAVFAEFDSTEEEGDTEVEAIGGRRRRFSFRRRAQGDEGDADAAEAGAMVDADAEAPSSEGPALPPPSAAIVTDVAAEPVPAGSASPPPPTADPVLDLATSTAVESAPPAAPHPAADADAAPPHQSAAAAVAPSPPAATLDTPEAPPLIAGVPDPSTVATGTLDDAAETADAAAASALTAVAPNAATVVADAPAAPAATTGAGEASPVEAETPDATAVTADALDAPAVTAEPPVADVAAEIPPVAVASDDAAGVAAAGADVPAPPAPVAASPPVFTLASEPELPAAAHSGNPPAQPPVATPPAAEADGGAAEPVDADGAPRFVAPRAGFHIVEDTDPGRVPDAAEPTVDAMVFRSTHAPGVTDGASGDGETAWFPNSGSAQPETPSVDVESPGGETADQAAWRIRNNTAEARRNAEARGDASVDPATQTDDPFETDSRLFDLRRKIQDRLRRKRCDDAAAMLQLLAQETGGRAVAELAMDAGDRCRGLGKNNAALNCYLAASRADPVFELPLSRLADICIDDQDIDLAVSYLERIARLHRLRGDEKAALRVYRRLVTVAPYREDILAMLMNARSAGHLDL